MKFRILGPLEVDDCALPGTVPGEQNRSLLAMLLLNAGRVVPAADLAAELWPHRTELVPPNTLHAQVTRLRNTLRKHWQDLAPVPLYSRSSGYVLDVEAGDIDVTHFHRLQAAAGTRWEQEPARAIARMREALALWRGSALQDAAMGRRCRAAAASLNEARLRAQEQLAQLRLRIEDPATIVDDLKELVHLNPMRETLLATLMRVLSAAGRRAEAITAYLQVRHRFTEDLGMEPGQALRNEYLRILKES